MFWNTKYNIVVTGAKGQLGSFLVRELSKMSFKRQSIVGKVFGIDIDDLDLSNSFEVANFFNRHVPDPSVKIDYVVHCAAATNTSAIEADPWKFYASNVLASRNVARSCAYNNIKLIFISTDYVFSEKSPVECGGVLQEFPVNQYGLQKLLAEKEVQIAYARKPKDLLIGRLSWLFGNSKNSFVEKLVRSIASTYARSLESNVDATSKVVHNVAYDAYGRPTPTWLVLDEVLYSIKSHAYGIVDYQYNTPLISRYEWASIIWQAFCSQIEALMLDASEENSNSILMKHSKDTIASLCNMIHDVSIEAISSSSLDLKMMHPLHPGKEIPKKNEIRNIYKQDAEDYVKANLSCLIDVAAEEIESKKRG